MDATTKRSDDDPLAFGPSDALSSLRSLSQAVGSEEASITALNYAAHAAATLVGADKAAIYMLADDSSIILEAGYKVLARTLVARNPCLAESMVRRSIFESTCVSVTDVAAEPAPEYPLKEGIASAVCVPIVYGKKTIGALLAMSKSPRQFSATDIEELQTIAGHAAPSVLRASGAGKGWRPTMTPHVEWSLIEFANTKIRNLTMLNQVSQAVTGTLDLEKLLDIVLQEAMTGVGATVGSLLLVDDAEEVMTIRASRGLSAEIISSTRVTMGEGISGWVASEGEPVLVHNARKDDRFRGISFRDSIASAMSVPLKAKNRVIGVLNLSTVERGRLFNEHDLELLGTLANQMAMAIEGARLMTAVQNHNKELSLLLEVAGSVGATLELDEVLDVLIEQICALADLRICCILLYSEQTERFRIGAVRGPDEITKHQYLDLSLPVALRTKETGRPTFSSDFAGYSHLNPDNLPLIKHHGLHAMLSIPLKVKTELVGVVVAFSDHSDAFTGSDVSLLASVGDLAGVAIQNARVYRRQHRMAQMLQKDLMPKAPLSASGIDVGQVYSPAREVGGDYFDFVSVGPDKIGFVVADVTGCSIPAAAYISMGKHVLRAYARDNASPANVLTRANRVIYEDTPSDMFISMFYGVFDLKAKTLRYAMAGHEPPIIYRPATDRLKLLECPGILIGILPDSDFAERKVSLQPGDIISFYTDGLTGAVVNHVMFGRQPIEEEMRKGALKPSQEIADNIHTRLLTFAEGTVSDDVAIVTIKIL